MKLKEVEEYINMLNNNDKIEMKKDVYEFISKNSNPEFLTISRNTIIYIPIFI